MMGDYVSHFCYLLVTNGEKLTESHYKKCTLKVHKTAENVKKYGIECYKVQIKIKENLIIKMPKTLIITGVLGFFCYLRVTYAHERIRAYT